nr:zinc finger, CCHC-type [Tanacetum cinerariifolium]
MSVVYVLTTLMPEDGGENPTVEQVKRRAKWDNDDYVYRGLIINGMFDSLFDVYQNVKTSKELWDTLEVKYMVEDASSKKFLVGNFINYKITYSIPVLEQYNKLLRILGRFTQHKINMDESIQVSSIIDKLPPSSWKDFKHTLKHFKEDLTLIELGSHLRIEESLKVQDSNKPKGNNVVGPSVINMVERNNSSRYNDNKGKRKHHDTKADPNKKPKVTCWKCGKPGHLKRDCKGGNVSNKANGLGIKASGDGSSNPLKAFMSTSKLNDLILWHSRLDHVHFKRMQDMSKDGLISAFDIDTKKCKTCMLTKITKKPFQNVKRKTKVLDLIHSDLCDLHATPSLGNKKYFMTFIDDTSRTDRGGEYMDTMYFQYVGIIYEMTTPYTPQQNGISERKNKVLKEMVNSKLSYSGLSQGEAVRLPDPKLKTLGERGIECIFIGYDEHSKAFRFYVIKPNDSFAINLIIESKDAIFDEHRFSSVPRPNQRSLKDGTEDSGGLVVSKRVTEEVVQQPKSELRKSKRHRTPKDFGPEFQLYLIEGTRDEISYQHSYCFNVEDDPKKIDEAMKFQDVTFWKEAINDEMDSNMGNNTWVLTDLPQVVRISTIRLLIAMASIHNLIIHQMDVKTAFLNEELEEDVYMNQHMCFIMPGNENKVDLTKEFLSSRFFMKGMGETDVILVSTPLDTCEKLMPNKGPVVSQLEYSRVIGCLMYAMTCTRHDIAFVVGKLSRYTSNPGTQHWQEIQGAFKKQTCITGSTMEYEFVVLSAAGNEAEWLKNLLFEISLWVKPMAPISIRCDSAATLAKAYSQMYNGKSRHLGLKHSMICKLITNGLVSIEFVRSQQNLADHLRKGLARDLVIKSAKGMRLKSN